MAMTVISDGSFDSAPEAGSLRSPPISQAELTIMVLVPLGEYKRRKQRTQNSRDARPGDQPMKLIPGAENDLNMLIMQDELVFAHRGPSGLVNGTKLAGWTSWNGLHYTTREELARQVMFLGTAKAGYNALSTNTPQNGIAIRFLGIANLLYMCNPEKPYNINPGEYLKWTVPKYSKRAFPFLSDRPAEKIVPVLEPFSFATLAQFVENMTRQAYSSKLETLPLTPAPTSSRPGVGTDSYATPSTGRINETLTPFQRLVQYDKTAEIVNALHVLWPLILRKYITVNVDGNNLLERHIPLSKVLKGKTDQDISDARKHMANLATLLGVANLSLESSNMDSVEMGVTGDTHAGMGALVNQVQRDVYMCSKYPRIPAEDVDQYHPNLNYATVKGATVKGGISSKDTRKLAKENSQFISMAQAARANRDIAMATAERDELAQVAFLNLTVSNPNSANPRTDALITHGAFV